jgi:hypothetical protein
MALAIDTLAYAKRLRQAGFTVEQAEGQAQALAAAMTDSLATKQDLSELEAHIDARLADLERRMSLRLGAIMVAGIGVVSVLVRLG